MNKLNVKSTEIEKHRIIYEDIIIEDSKQKLIQVCYGTLIINGRKAIKGNPVGIIEDIWTHEDFRKRGLGRQLVKELVELAREKGCYKVVLDCNDHNTAFYSKIGFKRWQNSMRIDLC